MIIISHNAMGQLNSFVFLIWATDHGVTKSRTHCFSNVAAAYSLWDISSPTRNWANTLGGKNTES